MGKKIYIWGAGYYGVLTALDLEQQGVKIEGFIDKNAENIKTVLGLPCVAPIPPDCSIIIACSGQFAINEITAILKSYEEVDYSISKIVLDVQNKSKVPPPPNTIPEELKSDFTMNGEIPVLYSYWDDRKTDFIIQNTAEDYEKAIKSLNDRTFKYYGNNINSFYDAFSKYSLKGKSVLIWGLAGLNCDAMAIWQGAEHVYVVDYNKPICMHNKITCLSHNELIKRGIKTDVAISFSSFEHDGLGRYGDPLNPNGDLDAMQTAHDFLKDAGFMLLGVPQGEDCLVWNAHRIYGEKRIPLLLKRWNVETSFFQESPNGQPLGTSHIHPLMVLRKD